MVALKQKTKLVATWKQIMFSPTTFFSSLKIPSKNARYDSTLFYLAVTTISLSLVFIVEAITAAISTSVVSEMNVFGFGAGMYSVTLFIMLPLAIMFSWGWLYVSSAFTHFFARLFGAKKGYDVTFAVNSYSSAPAVLQVIPLIGLVSFVYSTVLFIMGLKYQQEMSIFGAVCSVLIPMVIFIVCAILFMLRFVSLNIITGS